MGEPRTDPYAASPEVLRRAAMFLSWLNLATAISGVEFDPSYGGITVDGVILGNVRSAQGGFTIDVSNR